MGACDSKICNPDNYDWTMTKDLDYRYSSVTPCMCQRLTKSPVRSIWFNPYNKCLKTGVIEKRFYKYDQPVRIIIWCAECC
jgi:hypothetical protein